MTVAQNNSYHRFSYFLTLLEFLTRRQKPSLQDYLLVDEAAITIAEETRLQMAAFEAYTGTEGRGSNAAETHAKKGVQYNTVIASPPPPPPPWKVARRRFYV